MNPVYPQEKKPQEAGAYFTPRLRAGGPQKMIMEVEEWTAPVIDMKTGKVLEPAKVSYYRDNALLETKENVLGEIPIVHIPNYPLSGEFYGISDLVDIAELNRELNMKATDISDIINYHGSPTTILTGAKLKDLEKGSNRVWAIPKDAKVENLELSGDLAAATTHWKEVKKSMLELSGTPEQALGNVQQPSQTTAVALHVQYLPMTEKRDIKVLAYRMGIRHLNRLFLKLMAAGDRDFGAKFSKLKGTPYRNDVVFPDPMPRDEAKMAELSQTLLELGLTSKIRELEKRGISQNEARRIVKDWFDEKEKEMQLEMDTNFDLPTSTKQGSNPNRGGMDETRGEKISETVEGKGDQ